MFFKQKMCVLSLLMVLSFSCSSIRSLHKLGLESLTLDTNKWQGTWISGDGALQVKVVDAHSGEIEILMIENEKIEKHQVFINKNGSDTYGNLLTKEKHYIFVKFKMRKNELLMWLPKLDAIKAAIDHKKLVGVVNDKDILTESSKEVNNSYFIAHKEQILFEYEEPFIFKRDLLTKVLLL